MSDYPDISREVPAWAVFPDEEKMIVYELIHSERFKIGLAQFVRAVVREMMEYAIEKGKGMRMNATAENARLRTLLAETEKDTERLNWLEKNAPGGDLYEGWTVQESDVDQDAGLVRTFNKQKTVREAIDKAKLQAEGGPR